MTFFRSILRERLGERHSLFGASQKNMFCENCTAEIDCLFNTPVFDMESATIPISEPPFRQKRFLTSNQLIFIYAASPFLTVLGYGLNIFVCMGLSRTTTIKKPTAILMFAQMALNLISITCQGVAAPFLVRARLIDRIGNGISRFIAGISLFSTYTSLTLLIWITVNRHVFIWHPLRAEQVFTYRLALWAVSTSIGVGGTIATTAAFDCCFGGYSSVSMTFVFLGPRSLGQYVFAWIYIGTILVTCFAAYTALLWKIRKTKRLLARHHAAQRRIMFGMEIRLCVGFGIVASAWFVHLLTLIVPLVAFRYRHPSMSIFYAFSRWAMFLVDPFVYLLLTQDLRWATWKCFSEVVAGFLCCRRERVSVQKMRKDSSTVDGHGRGSKEEMNPLNSISGTRETSSSV